jgi:ribonuclease VapC
MIAVDTSALMAIVQHPAALNFGDCFAYEVAKEHGCRLLYVGDGFRKTDVDSVLGRAVP